MVRDDIPGRPGTPEGQGQDGALDERDADIYRHYAVMRWSQRKIANKFGINQQRVSAIIAKTRALSPPSELAEARRDSIELYNDIITEMRALADLVGAPVTAGKDGDIVCDPGTGEPVRDYALRIGALKLASQAEAELRKLRGLDSATRIESTSVVKYIVEGVDTSKLT